MKYTHIKQKDISYIDCLDIFKCDNLVPAYSHWSQGYCASSGVYCLCFFKSDSVVDTCLLYRSLSLALGCFLRVTLSLNQINDVGS